MKAYGQKRVYGRITQVLRAYAGKARKIYTAVKNRKRERAVKVEVND